MAGERAINPCRSAAARAYRVTELAHKLPVRLSLFSTSQGQILFTCDPAYGLERLLCAHLTCDRVAIDSVHDQVIGSWEEALLMK